MMATEYKAEGISIVDLSSEEITTAVQEFWQRCAETWQGELEDKMRQDEFWDICMAWPEYSRYHGWRHPESRAGAAWLRSLGRANDDSAR